MLDELFKKIQELMNAAQQELPKQKYFAYAVFNMGEVAAYSAVLEEIVALRKTTQK